MLRVRLRDALALLLCLSLALCGAARAEPSATGATVTDATGAVLPIPPHGERATIATVYAVAVPFLVALGLTDDVLAVNCKSRFWTDNVPALGRAGSVGRGVVDLEALAALEPTVLLHRANDPKTVEAVQALGIDVLCIRAESMDDVIDTLRMLGRYFGREERAEEVVAYIDAKFAQIDRIVAGIPEAERVTALVMGGEYGRIAGEDMLQTWMIAKAGGVPVARGIRNDCNWTQAGLETVFALDPAYLFLTSSTPLEYSAEELLADPVWSAMACVRDGRVRQIPARLDSWDLPGVVSVIGTMWMLHQMYPAYLDAEALQREVDEYYTLMFGRTFSAEELGYEP